MTTEAAVTESAPAAPPAEAAEPDAREAAAALFQKALNAPDAPAAPPPGDAPTAPPDAGAAPPVPESPPVAPAEGVVANPSEKKKGGNAFAEARQRAREARQREAELSQRMQAVEAERQRLAALAERAQQASQGDAAQAKLHLELAKLMREKPDEFVARLAKETGVSETEIIKRIQVRATSGAEVDEAQQEIQALRKEQQETRARLEAYERRVQKEQQAQQERAILAEYNDAVDAIVSITKGLEEGAPEYAKVDAEAWPNLAAAHPKRVERDVDTLLEKAYREVDNFRPTPAKLRQIATALNEWYGEEQGHEQKARSAKPHAPLSKAAGRSPTGTPPAAQVTGTPQQPASATPGNGSRVDIAAASPSGARRELSEEERRSMAHAAFVKSLHGDG